MNSNARWFTTSGGPVVPDLYNKLNNIKGNNQAPDMYSKNPVIQKMLNTLGQPEEDFVDDDFIDEEQNLDSDLYPEEKIEPIESSDVVSKKESNNAPKNEPKTETIKETIIDEPQIEYIKKTKCAIFDINIATLFLYPDNAVKNEDLIIFRINTENKETFVPKKNSGTFYCCFYDTVSDTILGCKVIYSNISFLVSLQKEEDKKIKFIIFKIVGEIKEYGKTESIPESNNESISV